MRVTSSIHYHSGDAATVSAQFSGGTGVYLELGEAAIFGDVDQISALLVRAVLSLGDLLDEHPELVPEPVVQDDLGLFVPVVEPF